MSGLWVGPLERGAVTGVHESDTLLCVLKEHAIMFVPRALQHQFGSRVSQLTVKTFGGPKIGRRKLEAPEAFQKFLRASQACLPASNVARGHPRCVHPSLHQDDCWPSRRRCPLFIRALMQGLMNTHQKRFSSKERKLRAVGDRSET